mgnify:CR=1 FL=1
MTHSLEVYREGKMIFSSDGRWLYPIFELEKFITERNLCSSELMVQDKIIGRAAALMLMHLGIRSVFASVLSRPGKAVLDRAGIDYRFDVLIEKVACRTEELLQDTDDPAEAYAIVCRRAGI